MTYEYSNDNTVRIVVKPTDQMAVEIRSKVHFNGDSIGKPNLVRRTFELLLDFEPHGSEELAKTIGYEFRKKISIVREKLENTEYMIPSDIMVGKYGVYQIIRRSEEQEWIKKIQLKQHGL